MEGLKDRFLANYRPGLLPAGRHAQSAVLLPLLRGESGEWQVLFEVRSARLANQPGEVCFPGGRIDPRDADARATAMRETGEELGLTAADLEVWGGMGMLISPFRKVIYPFAGAILTPERVRPDAREVAEVFTLRLTDLLAAEPACHEIPVRVAPPADFPFAKIPNGRDYQWSEGAWPEYFYGLEGRIVWGITALILHSFLAAVR